MPELYQGICARCGHTTPILRASYGAVLVDRPADPDQGEVAGAVIRRDNGGAFATAGDPRFVVLRHPVEDSDLASTGYSWFDVVWQGRYVAVTNVVCRRCGDVFQRRRLTAPVGTGCLAGFALGAAGGAVVGTLRHSFEAGFLVWYAVTMAVGLIASGLATLYLHLRFSERAASLSAERACPQCGSNDAMAVSRAKAVRCPDCSTESLRFAIVGIS